jgi:hypothetical protein
VISPYENIIDIQHGVSNAYLAWYDSSAGRLEIQNFSRETRREETI